MKIAVCGDMSVTEASKINFKNIDEKKTFNDLMNVFKDCDRNIVNLECALTESENKIRKFGPNLKGPLNTAKTLKKAGFTDCALSNNHIFDYGIEGLKDTIRELDESGLKWTGIGNNYEESRKNHIIVCDGVTLSIVNVCEHEYTYATEDRIGARPFDEFETMDDIREAKKSADYVMVIYHGGKEHCRYPSPRLRKLCREMVKCGADIVLCQHSHCIGCYEKFDNAHILYGQGNFHFVGYIDTKQWNEGMVVTLNLSRDKNEIEFIPIVTTASGIELAKGDRKQEMLNSLWERSETLHNGEWKKKWHEFCMENYGGYKRAICEINVEDDLDKCQRFAHYLDCEAHTDVWRELFPTWNHTNEK